jgi:hypothetical protein
MWAINFQRLQRITLVKSMNTPVRPLEELLKELSPQLQGEVQAFVESLLTKSHPPIKRKFRQDWAGKLKSDYPSMELQHLVSEWRDG